MRVTRDPNLIGILVLLGLGTKQYYAVGAVLCHRIPQKRLLAMG